MCQKGDVSQFFFMMHILYGVIRLETLDFPSSACFMLAMNRAL